MTQANTGPSASSRSSRQGVEAQTAKREYATVSGKAIANRTAGRSPI